MLTCVVCNADGYTVSDVVMYWKETPVRGVEDAELPQFTILGHETNDRVQMFAEELDITFQCSQETLATGVYQRLSLSFKLRRNIGYFVFQTYLPSILIVMLSWVSFWINHEATSARVALGITTVLTMTTISTGVRSSLPRISYVKAIDIYLVMCFVFVFAALLEYAAVNYTYWGARARKRAKMKNTQLSASASVEKDLKCSGNKVLLRFIKKYMMVTILWVNRFQISRGNNRPSRVRDWRQGLAVTGPAPPRAPARACRSALSAVVPRLSTAISDEDTLQEFPKRFNEQTKMMHALRRGASVLKASMPKIRDVNVIDTYSRVIFPVCFLLFNVVYWVFYILD
ncbi:Gamma-aminobutyric acid receptor subunit beta-like [Eumeta japonica]|uniref:Gamma-aminobutyric acid receptor subunit beta-like n=1 Tax=Eumeta variegata TaxID=151549 RepID=A0A4C1TSM3_EUMVA|nr:Gamma-aminobutyric acid receptor subunit beta-like [Eumeta japonica]